MYTALAPGTWEFRVRAIDAAGNTDPTPATATFTTAFDPAVTYTRVENGPYSGTNSEDVSFALAALQGGGYVTPNNGFACSLHKERNGRKISEMVSDAQGVCSYEGLPDGKYEFRARAADAASRDDVFAVHVLEVDTKAPEITFVGNATLEFVMSTEFVV